MTNEKNEPIACNLSVFTPEERERHLAEGRALHKIARGFMHMDRRLEIYFPPDTGPDRLERWAANELRCCGFLSKAHARNEADRVVLTLEAPGEGARMWSEMFMSGNTTLPSKDPASSAGLSRRGGFWALIVAAGAALACGLPIIGAYLVGREIMPAAWNVSESTYLMLGGGALLGYAGWKFRARFTKRAKGANSQGGGACGC